MGYFEDILFCSKSLYFKNLALIFDRILQCEFLGIGCEILCLKSKTPAKPIAGGFYGCFNLDAILNFGWKLVWEGGDGML